MKLNKQFFFRAGAIVLLVVLAVIMFIIGRGHNIYLDDKEVEIGGKTVEALYKITADIKGNEPQKIYERDRVAAKIMGQTLNLNLKVVDKKGGAEHEESFKIKVPHSMDGVVINLPLLLNGYDQSEWMSEFVQLTVATQEDSKVETDEFSMGDF